jgi:hypothetical protein
VTDSSDRVLLPTSTIVGFCAVPVREEPADVCVDLGELPAPLLELAKSGDLQSGSTNRSRVGQAFGTSFAVELVGEAQVRTVARIIGF